MNPLLLNFPDHFATERLDIRAPRAGDGAELNAAVIETWEDLAQWVPWARKQPTLDESEVLMREAAAKWLRREELWMLVFLKGTNTLVASSGLMRADWTVPRFEVGYWGRKRFAGMGYVTEAVRGIVEFAVRELGARRLHLLIDARNQRSRGVAKRAGFQLEGTQRQHLRANDGTLADAELYGLVP